MLQIGDHESLDESRQLNAHNRNLRSEFSRCTAGRLEWLPGRNQLMIGAAQVENQILIKTLRKRH